MSPKRLTRRDFLRLTALSGAGMAAASTLAACATPTPQVVKETVVVEKVVKETVVVAATPAPPGKFELVHWAEGYLLERTGEKFEPYRKLVREKYAALYPNVTIKWEDKGWDEELRQNLVTALLAGTAPDVVVGENFFQQYGDLGALLPVDEAIRDIKDNLIPGTYAAAVTKGVTYGINQFTGLFGFERNPNVIQKAGLDPNKPPTTWDELLEHCEIITKAGKGEFYGYTLQGPVGFSVGGIFRVAVYMKQAGADWTKEDGTTPFFDNPKAEPVLDFLRKINKFTPPGLTFNPDEGQVYTQLFKGVTAYQICGSWHVGWAKESGLQNAMYSSVPIPKGGKQASIVVGNVINAPLKVSKHPQEAIALCKIFTDDDIQDMVYPVLGRLPSTRSALERLKPKVGDADRSFIEQLLTADLGILPQWRKDPQKLWTIYNELLTKVLTTEAPIAGLMAEAQKAALAVVTG